MHPLKNLHFGRKDFVRRSVIPFAMRKPKQTPEEKQFVKDLKSVLKRMPDHLCLVTPHEGEQINVMRKTSSPRLMRTTNP